ncbi:hypothetical protein [Streptomyces sp. NPDC096351]|uniref:hypothetical protein n=1 Tax=Streptomyces sp. NPDC096351 TaxID=3366087 RepID=UPI003806D2C4
MAITTHAQAQAAVTNALNVLNAEKQQADQTGGSQSTDDQLDAVTAAATLLDRTPTS